MDDVLHQLGRALRLRRDQGVKHMIMAADNGYLFGDELKAGMKIDAPAVRRRTCIGGCGSVAAARPAQRICATSDFGLGGEEIATPWNFACFKVKAGRAPIFTAECRHRN